MTTTHSAKSELQQLHEEYLAGRIPKAKYIDRMHSLHSVFWQYQKFLKGKAVRSIEITQDNVIMTDNEGVRIICDPKDTRLAPMDIINFGEYEADELQMMRRYLKPDSVIVDVGANVGWYCIHLSRNIPHGRIIAFEPIPATYQHLLENLKLNNVKNVETHPYGLSDKEETLEFYFDPTLSVAASMRNLHEDRPKQMIKCPLKRMDDIVPAMTSRIDLLKCDIEGAEIFMLRGGITTIEHTRPVLFIEMLRKWSAKFGYHPNDIIALLVGVGYRCYAIDGDQLIPTPAVTEETKQTNFLFLHLEKHGLPNDT